MKSKTAKSILKRIRVTKHGKMVRSGSGLNHFLSKKKSSKKMDNRRSVNMDKIRSRMLATYLHHTKV
ncbi:50S ribosomal protein L35 [Candidatus Giovannonibacteria bacterium]|nr:50S ribosomal protein L35 [Candidatus Giovannonibacteria bacterium]